jgi:serine/threonine protein kinase HipA of HipAB toxin-antitoxin module
MSSSEQQPETNRTASSGVRTSPPTLQVLAVVALCATIVAAIETDEVVSPREDHAPAQQGEARGGVDELSNAERAKYSASEGINSANNAVSQAEANAQMLANEIEDAAHTDKEAKAAREEADKELHSLFFEDATSEMIEEEDDEEEEGEEEDDEEV